MAACASARKARRTPCQVPLVNEDKASRYHRLKRQASVASLLWGVGLLVALLATGTSASLRNAAVSAAGALPAAVRPHATAVLFVALLSLINELGSIPLAFYSGYFLERRYD